MSFEELPTVAGTAVVEATSLPQLREYLPTMVTFGDLDDPATAKVVCAEGNPPVRAVEATFGPGYAFRRLVLEIVPDSTLTHNAIEKRLPRLIDILERESKVSGRLERPSDPYRPALGQFQRIGR